MITRHGVFDVIVFFLVMLAGMAFGAWAGRAYSLSHWWVGMLVGLVSSFMLAVWYLKQLARGTAQGHSKIRIGFSGTFLGLFCGAICTVLIHSTMLMFADMPRLTRPNELFPQGMLWVVFLVGGALGVVSGFLIGGICSTIYVCLPKDDLGETA